METHSVANDVHAGRAARITGDLIELQERERGMMAIIESAQDLSSRLDLTSLLSAIVSRAPLVAGKSAVFRACSVIFALRAHSTAWAFNTFAPASASSWSIARSSSGRCFAPSTTRGSAE